MAQAALIKASAPGKLLVLGEYAVLRGAPAIVMAVDCRARVSLRPSQHRTWRLTASQLNLHDYPLDQCGQAPSTRFAKSLNFSAPWLNVSACN